jgi:probable LLM family oxidoreductase
MELGLYSFADIAGLSGQERIRNLIEEISFADQVGLDVFGVGEHHRPDFAVSAPAVVLAAAAERSKHIRLTSAVTVLSSDDPIRVFQQFATVDLISGGRAEIMVGRGSFIESFPLFGYDLNQYDTLFSEKLERLLQLREQELGVFPRPIQDPLPIWIAVGGTPQSAVRAGTLGLPLAVAIIGGMPERFRSFADLYRNAAKRAGHDAQRLALGINSLGYVAKTSRQARDEFYPAYSAVMNKLGRERGWPAMSRSDFEAVCGPRGALLVGSPDEVSEKILFEHEIFDHQRTLVQMSIGSMPHAQILNSIELFGTRVAPAVRTALRSDETDAAGAAVRTEAS